MPVTNVKSAWSSGDLQFKDASGNVIMSLDGTNRQIDIPSGSNINGAATGAFTFAAGEIEAADLAAGAVTAAALDGQLAKGFIPLNLYHAYIISSNNTINTTEGAFPDGNTAPILSRINAATDKTMRLIWAANDVSEVQFPPIPLPNDLDDTADMTIHLYLYKDANANATVTIDCQVFFNVGDTECGAATGAIAVTTPTEFTATVAAADVPAAPGVMTVALVPAAHNSDALYLLGAWVEYTRKA